MNRARHPRIASLVALACFAVGATSLAQPRRGRPGAAAAATEPAATTEIPTVATVAADVCIAPEARARALECPAGAQRYGSRQGTSPPAAARATEAAPRPQSTRGPEGRLDRSSLLRNQDRQRRSQDILLQETRLTASLVNRMRAEDPNRPPTLMRLAENYQELSSMANGLAEDLEENIHQARQANNAAEVTALQARQTQYRTQAREYRDQLIASFENLVRTAPNFAQMDRALFYLGFALQEATRNDEALRVYRTLVQRFPNSPFVPNAYLSFGEFYFEQGNMENARQFYERVLAVQDESNQVYGYALYKMAWVLYNLQDHQGALQKFYEVIDYARAHPQATSVTALLRNARMELVAVYGAVYGNAQRPLNTGTALATFRRYAADDANANAMFERLAELYQDNGQWPNAIACYHALMESRSSDDRFCFWQAQVARGVIASRPKPEQLVEVNRLVDVYNTFRQASSRSQEVRNTCRNHAARVVFDVASHWHLEAIGRSAEGQAQTRGTRNPETMRMVAELYQKIVDEFPEFDQVEFPEYDRRDWPTLYRVRYYRADVLRDQGNFEACGPAYDAVVESNPEGEYTEDAAYKAVLCYNDWFQQRFAQAATRNQVASRSQRTAAPRNQTPEQIRAAERARLVPRDLNTMETGMVRAFTRYVCFVQPTPGQRDADGNDIRTLLLTIKYRRAYAYYTANHFEEAATLFRDIAESDQAVPDPENLREISADLLLDALNVMGEMWNPQRPACFDQMAETLPRLMSAFCGAGTRAQREDFCHRVEELQCQVLRKKAETLAGTRRFAEAARETINIVRSHRECGRLDEMLYNAAIYYDAAFMLSRAIRVRERLVELFLPRDSIWAVRGLYRLAGNYHAIQVFGRAADEYERYADYVATHRAQVEAGARTAAEQARARGSSAPAENPIEQAADALRQATIFRIGLGMDDRALANGQKFARLFGNDPQRRRVAAGVVYSLGQIYRDRVERLRRSHVSGTDERRARDQQIRQAWSDLVRHYSDFMRRYAEQGTVDQKIQGAVALARGYWNLQDTRQASTYFQQAVTLWGTPAAQGQQSAGERQIREQLGDQADAAVEASKDAVAEARFYLAEVLYQRFMAARLPTIPGTNRAAFDRWATNQLTPYIQNRQRLLDEAQRKYTEVIQMEIPNWQIAAAARIADMNYQFAVTIRTSPVPPDVQRNPDLMDAWNLLRDERTQPYINTATTGFQACITLATRVHWFNEWSQLAERSLNAIDRGRFPLADEIRVEPDLVFSRPSNARPVYALGTQVDGGDDEGSPQGGGESANPPAGGR